MSQMLSTGPEDARLFTTVSRITLPCHPMDRCTGTISVLMLLQQNVVLWFYSTVLRLFAFRPKMIFGSVSTRYPSM